MPNQTSAIVFEDKEKAVLKTIDLPEPTADELLVRMTVSGVSVGTERWALLGRRPEMKFPFVTGYLGVGVVEQAGSKVNEFKPGDRVFTTAARPSEPFRTPPTPWCQRPATGNGRPMSARFPLEWTMFPPPWPDSPRFPCRARTCCACAAAMSRS